MTLFSLSWAFGFCLLSISLAGPVGSPSRPIAEDDAVASTTENSPSHPVVVPDSSTSGSVDPTSGGAPASEPKVFQSTPGAGLGSEASTSAPGYSGESEHFSSTAHAEASTTAAHEAISSTSADQEHMSPTSHAQQALNTVVYEEISTTSGDSEHSVSTSHVSEGPTTGAHDETSTTSGDPAHPSSTSTASEVSITSVHEEIITTSGGLEHTSTGASEHVSTSVEGEVSTSAASESCNTSSPEHLSSTSGDTEVTNTGAPEHASTTSGELESSTGAPEEHSTTGGENAVSTTTPVPKRPSSPGSSTGQPGVRKVSGQEHKKEGDVTKITGDGLQICTWNVFRFGPTKFKQPDEFVERYGKEKLKMMVEQISHADILAMQEYFDKSLVVLNKLRDALTEASGSQWNYTVSESVGRTSKEQYVFLYRTDVAKAAGDDIFPQKEDIFSRTPFFTNFKVNKPGVSLKDITLGTIHTEPKSAVAEMNGLIETYDWAKKKFGTEDVMVLGDYNADCQYVRKSEWPKVKLFTDPSFQWFIPTGTDTASMNSECTFDRAVVRSPKFKKAFVPGSMRVLDFVTQYGIKVSEARQLSDHFPVCLTFK